MSESAVADLSISKLDINAGPVDTIEIFLGPGQRLGISLISVKAGVKVAGISKEGAAKQYVNVGDFILEVNGTAITNEKEGLALLASVTAGECVIKLRRGDSAESSDGTGRSGDSTPGGAEYWMRKSQPPAAAPAAAS